MAKAQTAPQAEIKILLNEDKVTCKLSGNREEIIQTLSNLFLDKNPDPNCFRSLMEEAMALSVLTALNESMIEKRKDNLIQNFKRPKDSLPN